MSEILSSGRLEFQPAPRTTKTAVAIVATGPSFTDFPQDVIGRNVYIIAVKGAIFNLKRVDAWITVDANRRCRQRQMALYYRKPGVQYYAAVPADYGTQEAYRQWHRAPAEKGIHYLERIGGVGLAEDPRQIITGNSAYAALGLAFHMGFKHIGLFGVDATQDAYGTGHGGRPRGDLGKLHDLFADAIPQLSDRGIEVRNAGQLKTWPTEKALEVAQWLNAASS